jgi:hypothetical protein
MKGKCRFVKLQLFLQLNRDYLSKKPLFFRRKEDENFKEKNPFRQVPLNAPSYRPILQKDQGQNPLDTDVPSLLFREQRGISAYV